MVPQYFVMMTWTHIISVFTTVPPYSSYSIIMYLLTLLLQPTVEEYSHLVKHSSLN